jgi:hypothetical protein
MRETLYVVRRVRDGHYYQNTDSKGSVYTTPHEDLADPFDAGPAQDLCDHLNHVRAPRDLWEAVESGSWTEEAS